MSSGRSVKDDCWQSLGEATAKLVTRLREKMKTETAPTAKQEPISSPSERFR
jgi:hypothetical protein